MKKETQSLASKIEQYIQEKKTFTIQELYNEFGSNYKRHSIRARVYENRKAIRTSRGNYMLVGAELEAIIEQADSRKHIFEIKKMNIYYDLLYFDIPYMVGGVKGGNRNLIDYPTITPFEFQQIILEAQKMLRTENSQVVFMIAGGKSSIKQSQQYINQFNDTTLKLNSQGTYTKLTQSGKVCNMGRYMMPSELILSYSHDGKARSDIENNDMNTDFRFQRPQLPKQGGYRTQKPLGFMQEIIKRTTRKGEILLDLFAGSGVSLEAALGLQRKAHLVELSPIAIENFIVPKLIKFEDKTKLLRPKKQLNLFDFINTA